MKKIIYGIVTFRESFWETDVFINIIKQIDEQESLERPTIFIYDNTDLEDWNIFKEYQQNDFIEVIYNHNSENVGISKAYNTIALFAKENGFDYILFLDQDTELPLNFLSEYTNMLEKNVDIAAPLIYEGEKLLSPAGYKNYRSSSYKKIESNVIRLKNNSCINSGLLIRTVFFEKVGGYNEKLRLDFCDHEFIKRVSHFTKDLNIIPVKLKQNFSTNTNPSDKALFRYSLFTKDVEAFKRINNGDLRITFFVDLPHLIRLTLQYRSLAFIKQRLF